MVLKEVIYKYPLSDGDIIELPRHPDFLTVAVQNDVPVMWVRRRVRERFMSSYRVVRVLTGEEIVPFDSNTYKYLGTTEIDSFVEHWFIVVCSGTF